MNDFTAEPSSFSQLSAAEIGLWRESLAHLRHLNEEAGATLKFFLSLNTFVLGLAVVVAIFRMPERRENFLLFGLAVFGGIATLIGRYIFKRQRIYYVQMLLKKTLLENELGFYQKKFPGSETDLAFPWRLAPEAIAELKTKPEDWIQKSIRGPGTIARWQFFLFDAVLVIYFLMLLLLLARTLIELPVPA